MSYALVFGGLAALLMFIGGITALFWWIHRPVPRGRRFASAPLPLFSHARASVWARDEDLEPEEGTAADLMADRMARGEHDRGPVPSWRAVPATDGHRDLARRSGVPKTGK